MTSAVERDPGAIASKPTPTGLVFAARQHGVEDREASPTYQARQAIARGQTRLFGGLSKYPIRIPLALGRTIQLGQHSHHMKTKTISQQAADQLLIRAMLS